MKRFIWFAVVGLVIAACGQKSVFSVFPQLHYQDHDLVTTLQEEDVHNIFIDLIMFNSCNSVTHEGKLYFVHPFNRDGKHVARVFSIDEKFNVQEALKIPSGKGPGEAMAIKYLFFKDNDLYLWDPTLCRFLIYDNEFQFIDTYNLERNVLITAFYSYKGDVYALSGQEDGFDIYRIEFLKNIKLSFVKSIRIKIAPENKQVSDLRKRVSVFKETDGSVILKAFNLVLFYDKERMEFVREAGLGFQRTDNNGVVEPNLLWISDQGDILFSYRYQEGYLLRSGDNKAKKIDHKDIAKVLDVCGSEFIIVKNNDIFRVFRK